MVADWRPMLQRLETGRKQLELAPANRPERGCWARRSPSCAWLEQANFTFLGARAFELTGDADTGDLAPVDGSGLGVLRDAGVQVLRRGSELVAMTPEVRRFFFAPSPLIITKANVVSRVHRRAHMDYIGIKTYHADGKPKGEVRFVGLFTSQAYVSSPSQIPLLRHKVDTVLAASGYPAASHAGKALLNVLDTFPRDELFQIGAKELQAWSEGILDLETRPRVRLFTRIDRFDRFVSALLYVPRDRYNTRVRERIGALLCEAYDGRIAAFYPYFPDGPLVRVQFIVARFAGPTPHGRRRRAGARDRRDRAHLGGPAGRRHRHPGRARRSPAGQVRDRLFRRLCGDLPGRARAGGHQAHRAPGPRASRRHRFLSRARHAREPHPRRGLFAGCADPPLRARAGAGEPGLLGHRRALLSHPAALCRTASAT